MLRNLSCDLPASTAHAILFSSFLLLLPQFVFACATPERWQHKMFNVPAKNKPQITHNRHTHTHSRIHAVSWDFWTSKPPSCSVSTASPPSPSVCFTLLAEARFQLRLRLGFGLGCAFKWKITFAALWCGNYMKIMANLPLTRRCDEDLSTQRFFACMYVCVHTVLVMATLERKKQLKFFQPKTAKFSFCFSKIFHDISAISSSWTSLLTVKTRT